MIARFAPLQKKILRAHPHPLTHTHTHPFNGPLSRTNWVSRYQKGETNLDFTEARDSELQWHQLGRVQVCTSLQTDNHASTPPLSFYSFLRPSCRPTNSVKALKAQKFRDHIRLVHKYLHFACSDVTDRLLYPNSYRIGNCRKLSPTEFTLTTSHHETRDVNWRLDPTQLSSIV